MLCGDKRRKLPTDWKGCLYTKHQHYRLFIIFLHWFVCLTFPFTQARRIEQLARRKVMIDQLFDKWDNDGSGYLDLDELHSVMSKFKENMEKKIVAKGM